eukprot:1095320-Prymnesium_polylepis.1
MTAPPRHVPVSMRSPSTCRSSRSSTFAWSPSSRMRPMPVRAGSAVFSMAAACKDPVYFSESCQYTVLSNTDLTSSRYNVAGAGGESKRAETLGERGRSATTCARERCRSSESTSH